jgi:hypothetical protein
MRICQWSQLWLGLLNLQVCRLPGAKLQCPSSTTAPETHRGRVAGRISYFQASISCNINRFIASQTNVCSLSQTFMSPQIPNGLGLTASKRHLNGILVPGSPQGPHDGEMLHPTMSLNVCKAYVSDFLRNFVECLQVVMRQGEVRPSPVPWPY